MKDFSADVFDQKTGARYACRVSALDPGHLGITLAAPDGGVHFYRVPVRRRAGMAWKVGKKSVSSDSGLAADMVQLFARFGGHAYLGATVNALIFSGNIKTV